MTMSIQRTFISNQHEQESSSHISRLITADHYDFDCGSRDKASYRYNSWHPRDIEV